MFFEEVTFIMIVNIFWVSFSLSSKSDFVVHQFQTNMSTLDDKILGIKKDYYCSSSESEDEDSDECEGKKCDSKQTENITNIHEATKWDGASKNTGPKGVIRDWELYKQLENEKLVDQQLQNIALAKKLTLSNSQHREDEVDKELMDLMDDDFLLEYRKKRMEEMLTKPTSLPRFGAVISLKNGCEFLDAIDNENKSITIIIHIYEDGHSGCKRMNQCLETLCQQYPTVKFCKMVGSSAGMSHRWLMIF